MLQINLITITGEKVGEYDKVRQLTEYIITEKNETFVQY